MTIYGCSHGYYARWCLACADESPEMPGPGQDAPRPHAPGAASAGGHSMHAGAMTRSWRSSRQRRRGVVRRLLARIDRWLDDHDRAITRAQGVFLVGVFVWLVWAAGHVGLGW